MRLLHTLSDQLWAMAGTPQPALPATLLQGLVPLSIWGRGSGGATEPRQGALGRLRLRVGIQRPGPLGSGVNGVVYALAAGCDGRLSVGSAFTMNGDTRATRFTQWTAAVRQCDLAVAGTATFYVDNRPVVITVRTPGDLACIAIQHDTMSHPNATADLQTGAFWEIRGTTSTGSIAMGFSVDLTLPGPATVNPQAQVCRWDGSMWDCAASSVAPGAITWTHAAYGQATARCPPGVDPPSMRIQPFLTAESGIS